MSHSFKIITAHKTGQITELKAKQFLERQGLNFIAQNVRFRCGEIDLIMQEQNVIIFVEVKYRRRVDFGGAIHAISQNQIDRLLRAGEAWLQQYDSLGQLPCRFDLIALTGNLSNLNYQWLKNISQ